MPKPNLGPAGVTVYTPPALEIYQKVAYLDTSAGDAVGFLAFALPKGCIPTSIFFTSMGANVAQTINLGTTLGGGQLVNALACNGAQFNTVGTAVGALFGTQLTADTPIYAKASAQLTSPVRVLVRYYIPQQGMTW